MPTACLGLLLRVKEKTRFFPNDLPNKATHFVAKAAPAAIFFDERKTSVSGIFSIFWAVIRMSQNIFGDLWHRTLGSVPTKP
jgi:hypothetical protein